MANDSTVNETLSNTGNDNMNAYQATNNAHTNAGFERQESDENELNGKIVKGREATSWAVVNGRSLQNGKLVNQNDGKQLSFTDPTQCEKEFHAGPSRSRVTGRLCLSVASAIMGSVEFGYHTGVINAPEMHIKEFMNHTNVKRTGNAMDDVTIRSLFALTVSIFAVGGVIGGLTAGWWANFLGRKGGMLVNNIIGIIASVLMFLSRVVDSYEIVIVGRFLIGINCGLYTGLTPMYLSEVSSLHIRGALGTLHQLGTVTGLFASQVLGFPEILGNASYWNILLGVGLTPLVLQLLTLPLCPESPRYLLLTKNKESQAREALIILRGTTHIDDDIEEMKSENNINEKDTPIGLMGLFREKSLRMPLIISIVMQLSQQFSGINAIFYYSFNLFKHAGLSDTWSAHATSGVGGTMVVMSLITVPLMDRVGRRTLHLFGLGGMFIFSILITLSLSLTYLASWLRVANIAVSLLYVVFFGLGPGSIPWLIVAEMFSQGPRPVAISVSVFTNWVANFTVGYCFPYMQSGLGNFSFLPFTITLGLFFIFTAKFVPETKNRTIEQISQIWKKSGELTKL